MPVPASRTDVASASKYVRRLVQCKSCPCNNASYAGSRCTTAWFTACKWKCRLTVSMTLGACVKIWALFFHMFPSHCCKIIMKMTWSVSRIHHSPGFRGVSAADQNIQSCACQIQGVEFRLIKQLMVKFLLFPKASSWICLKTCRVKLTFLLLHVFLLPRGKPCVSMPRNMQTELAIKLSTLDVRETQKMRIMGWSSALPKKGSISFDPPPGAGNWTWNCRTVALRQRLT